MSRFLLDTSALLTLRDDEPGADLVARTLGQSRSGDAQCFGCFISLMEVYDRVWKDENVRPQANTVALQIGLKDRAAQPRTLLLV